MTAAAATADAAASAAHFAAASIWRRMQRQILLLLNVMTGRVIRIDDHVEVEQSVVLRRGQVPSDLRCEDVVIWVHQKASFTLRWGSVVPTYSIRAFFPQTGPWSIKPHGH